ncbi:hypothetical protein E1B28_005851 [Marasmius oreades]|uniref:Uncharacterized protein n=1 Tax=Marasmius oreades TaxID=181124 RepID=A0A9P7S5H1_9AGAR|nr:uncharacterized protein E1B28_005851 [Marasmius oreades]KAG7095061.1 hypothetical protein E1B28_005851 [Marasmius oreades]
MLIVRKSYDMFRSFIVKTTSSTEISFTVTSDGYAMLIITNFGEVVSRRNFSSERSSLSSITILHVSLMVVSPSRLSVWLSGGGQFCAWGASSCRIRCAGSDEDLVKA